MKYIFNRTIIIGVGIIVALLLVFKFIYAPAPPVMLTGDYSLTQNTTTLTGNITNSDGQDSERGFKWGTSPGLDKAQTISASLGKRKFTAKITGLVEGAAYYQAYTANRADFDFGEIKNFIVSKGKGSEADDDSIDSSGFTQEGTVPAIIATGDGAPLTLGKKRNTAEKTVRQEVKPEPARQAAAASPAVDLATEETASSSRGGCSNYRPTGNSSYPKLSKVNGYFGQFRYRDTSGGRIEIDPQWVQGNIVTITLPGINRQVQVHKKAAEAFIKAFTLIENGTVVINGKIVPLTSLVKTMDGTWVPRHIMWNANRGLSNHSWGTAIDINASGHYRYVDPGKEPNDPNLILWEKAFRPAGFSWGNSYDDAMHYELLW